MRIGPDHQLVPLKGWREKVFRVIYLSNTNAGKLFDIILLSVILISTVTVIIETVPTLSLKTIRTLYDIEAVISILFTIEYILRIACVKNKKDYIFSFNGIIDLLAIVPFYLSIFFPATLYFIVIRLLRLLRVFRIFNLLDYMHDGRSLIDSIRVSARKVYIFLLFMLIFIIIMGSIMFVVERGQGSFDSIPNSIYWAAVTVSTLGYGDMYPTTAVGKFITVLVSMTGYGIIATATIIVTLDFQNMKKRQAKVRRKACDRCGNIENDADARYCKRCGARLPVGELTAPAPEIIKEKSGGLFHWRDWFGLNK